MARDKAYEDACAQLRDALQAMASVIGPRMCPECAVTGEECEHDWDETTPMESVMLNGFVLATTWTSMAAEPGDYSEFSTMLHMPGQPWSHTAGLLHVALYS